MLNNNLPTKQKYPRNWTWILSLIWRSLLSRSKRFPANIIHFRFVAMLIPFFILAARDYIIHFNNRYCMKSKWKEFCLKINTNKTEVNYVCWRYPEFCLVGLQVKEKTQVPFLDTIFDFLLINYLTFQKVFWSWCAERNILFNSILIKNSYSQIKYFF